MSAANDDDRTTMTASAAAASEDGGNQRDKWKRHEFGDFLTENGVTAAIANAILELCRMEKKPTDPIEFIRVRMRPDNEDLIEIESFRRKIVELGTTVDDLRAENDRLLEVKRRIQLGNARQQCDGAQEDSDIDDYDNDDTSTV